MTMFYCHTHIKIMFNSQNVQYLAIILKISSTCLVLISHSVEVILKYADILWNRTFGCFGRQAFNYYCSLFQV